MRLAQNIWFQQWKIIIRYRHVHASGNAVVGAVIRGKKAVKGPRWLEQLAARLSRKNLARSLILRVLYNVNSICIELDRCVIVRLPKMELPPIKNAGTDLCQRGNIMPE